MTPRLLSLALLAFSVSAQNSGSAKIAKVEHGLLPAVRIKGAPVEHYDIQSRMAHYRVPGVSVAVINNYVIEWAKGYGYRDKEAKLPVDSQTLFEAGSISKPVAATGALWLVDRHKLALDDDVNGKLKSWKVPENEFTRNEKVTLRRLLSHSAGLTVHGFPGYEAGKPVPSVPQVLDGATPANTAAVRVDLVPGTQFRYSGGGYTVMQLLVADVAGKPFPEFLAETVLRKIGMDRSTYEQPLPSRLAGNAATAYEDGAPIPGKYHTYPEMAAAGLWTTASDLARFGIEIMKSAEGRSSRVLSREIVDQMLTKQSGDYGLGFGLEGPYAAPRFSHGGVDEGFEAMLVCLRASGKGAVVMTNAQGGMALAREILLGIAAEYGWPDYQPKERGAIQLAPEVLSAYAGRYTSPMGDVRIAKVGKGLEVEFRGNRVTLVPESETRFFALGPGVPDIEFERGPDGKVKGFSSAGLRGVKVE
jgi:CubicO group peptidase (beta-lactamase class C family)